MTQYAVFRHHEHEDSWEQLCTFPDAHSAAYHFLVATNPDGDGTLNSNDVDTLEWVAREVRNGSAFERTDCKGVEGMLCATDSPHYALAVSNG